MHRRARDGILTVVAEPKRRKKKRRPRVLDAYRADVSATLARVLGLAAALVLTGSIAAGSGIVSLRMDGVPVAFGRRPSVTGVVPYVPASSTAWALGALGLTLVIAGGAVAVLGLRRILREERYVLLRSDGALFVRGKARRVVKWRDVEDVRHEDGALVFHCHDGTALTIDGAWGGVSLDELARRAAQLRRRALFGLIR